MAFNVGEISANVTADQSDFNSAMKDVHKRGMRVSQKLGDAFMGIGRKLTMGLTVPIGLAGGAMIKMASDAEETEAKFNTVFSNISSDAQKSAKVLTDSFGLSQKASQQLLGDTGDLLTGFGFTQEAALDLSEDVNKLAVDLASFTNFSGGAEGASQALTKALLGERESVKSLGISILEADVTAKRLENTQKGLTFETERQAKAYATLQLAQEQSKNAIGDFARTQDSFANQMRQLRAEVSDLAVEFGKELLPIAKSAVGVARNLISDFSGLSEESKKLGLKIAGIAAIAGPTLMFLGSMIKAVSSLSIIVPKLAVAMKALTAAMVANPYIAVGAAIAVIATKAVMAYRETKKLNEEINNALQLKVKSDSLNEINESITQVEGKIKELRESNTQGMFGKSLKDVQRINELSEKLEELKSKRADIAMGLLRKELENTEPKVTKVKEAVEQLTNSYKNFSVAINEVNDRPLLDPTEVDRLYQARQAAIGLYTPLSQLMDVPLGEKMQQVSGESKKGGMAMMGLANSIGNMFSQAVLHGNKLEDVVKNLLKQLASRAFVTGIGALLTGGTSLAGSSFLGALFGGFRANGGPVSSGMSYVVGEQGPEIFTPSRSGSIIPNSGSVNGGSGMSTSQMSKAFEMALDRKLSKLGADEIFALSQRGRVNY